MSEEIKEKKGSEEVIVYLIRPYLSPNGDLYPILPNGYNLRHLPPTIMQFPHKKMVGSKEELDKFLKEQRKKESAKDRDFRVDFDASDTVKLKEEISELKTQNKSLQGSVTQMLNEIKALKDQLNPKQPPTSSKTTKKE